MPAKALLVVAEIVRHTEQPIPRLVDVASLAQCLEHAEEGLLNELVCVNRSGAAEVQVTKNRVIVFFIQLPDLLSGIPRPAMVMRPSSRDTSPAEPPLPGRKSISNQFGRLLSNGRLGRLGEFREAG